MFQTTYNVMRIQNDESEQYETKCGLKQGCVPMLLSAVVDDAKMKAKGKMKPCHIENWKKEKVPLTDMMFADDI